MPLSFPLELGDFGNLLPIVAANFELQEFVQESGTAQGDAQTAYIAFPKWRCDISLAPMEIEDANDIISRLEAIGRVNRFKMFNPLRPYPRQDPTGSVVGSSTLTVNTIGSDNTSLKIEGLPVGYRLRYGDMFSINYGSSPVRKGLFRVVDDVTVPGSGISPFLGVAPAIHAGISAGDSVDVTKPNCLFKMLAYSTGSPDGAMTSGVGFSAIEAVT